MITAVLFPHITAGLLKCNNLISRGALSCLTLVTAKCATLIQKGFTVHYVPPTLNYGCKLGYVFRALQAFEHLLKSENAVGSMLY